MQRALLVIALSVALVVGACSGTADRKGTDAANADRDAQRAEEVEAQARAERQLGEIIRERETAAAAGPRHWLEVHCGVQSTWFENKLWLADPPLGDHNPPKGWDDNRVEGHFAVTAAGVAEFRGENGERATFRLAPEGSTDPAAGCE